MSSTIVKSDVRRAFALHLEVIREAGIDAPYADLQVSRPGDGHVRYEPINVPTISNRTYIGARSAHDAITAATFAVQELLFAQRRSARQTGGEK